MSKPRRRNHRDRREYVYPLRFTVDADRGVGYPPMNLAGTPSELREWPTLGLSPAVIVGADPASLGETSVDGDMTLIRLADGTEPFGHHLLVHEFAYSLVPVPTLSFTLEPNLPNQPPTLVQFTDATISDWSTDRDYSPDDPNNELCEFLWDCRQNFLLEFLSFKIIVQAATLELHPVAAPAS